MAYLVLLLVSDLNWSKELIFPLIGLGQSRWGLVAWLSYRFRFAAQHQVTLLDQAHLRIFAPFAGLLFGLWGCYPAKLLFGPLQLSSKALDESIILCSHIDLRGLVIFKMSWNECWIQGSCGVWRSGGPEGGFGPLLFGGGQGHPARCDRPGALNPLWLGALVPRWFPAPGGPSEY
jgi:hypothetical protein